MSVLRQPRVTPAARPRRTARLRVEGLEDRTVPDGGPTQAAAIPLVFTPAGDAAASGSLTAGEVEWYSVNATGSVTAAQLSVRVLPGRGTPADPFVALFTADGRLLINSDDGLAQHLTPGTYFLAVSAPGGTGQYQLNASLAPVVPPFEPLPTGSKPLDVASADLNGDGVVDLVVVNNLSEGVGVHLGRGDGTFRPQQTFSTGVGSQPQFITLADFDGDDRPDLAVTNLIANNVVVMLNNGDGTFRPGQNFAAGSTPRQITSADLNADGAADLVVVTPNASAVGVFLGNGDGTFAPGRSVEVGPGGSDVVAVDLDGDGLLDLAVSNGFGGLNRVNVLAGDGRGGFRDPRTFTAGAGAFNLEVADLNGDGRPDIAVVNYIDDTVSVLLAKEGGGFDGQATYAAGEGPVDVRIGDFDADGALDLGVSNQNGDTVSVLLGRGDGTFRPQEMYATGQNPGSIGLDDLNADGAADLFTVNLGSNTVSVLLGRGDGTFREQGTPVTQSRPVGSASADLNGDGNADVAVSNSTLGTVSVLLGRGDGTFQPQQEVVTSSGPVGVTLTDLNSDGRIDLVVTAANFGLVSVFLGAGDGTFGPEHGFAVGDSPVHAAAGDLNRDGKPDLVVANASGNTVSLLLGNGDGTFQAQRAFAAGTQPQRVVIADFNGDGSPDAAVTNRASNNLSLFLGDGAGGLAAARMVAVGILPVDLVAGDIDGDGDLDLVASSIGNRVVFVLTGDGKGGFAPARTSPAFAGFSLGLADYDGDGDFDVALANAFLDQVSLLAGNGKGTFAAPRAFATGAAGKFPRSLLTADLNGDGRPDVTTANYGSGSVTSLLNDGAGTLLAPRAFSVGTPPVALALADLNGDGRPDRVTTDFDDAGVAVQLARGGGTFQPPQFVELGAGVRPEAVAAVDLNGDGRADLAVADSASDRVYVLLGVGDGSFRPAQTYAVGNGPSALAFGDVNGDGRTDLVTADRVGGTVSLLRATPDGSFGPPLVYRVGPQPTAVTLADLDGDGDLDLAVVCGLDRTVRVLLGEGDGAFAQPFAYAAGSGPIGLAAADLDGDGRMDLAVANNGSDNVTVLFGTGGGVFGPPQTFAAGERPSAVAAADVTSDGLPDLVVTNYNAGTVSVLAGLGGGRFAARQAFAAFPQTSPPFARPDALAVADLNGDGRPDLSVASFGRGAVGVLLGVGGAQPFVQLTPENGVEFRNTPLAADLTGDGRLDVVTLDRSGAILLRPGAADGSFGVPVAIGGPPARDLALLRTASGGHALAAVGATGGVAVYSLVGGRAGTATFLSSSGLLPARVGAADLDGDNDDDLVVADALGNSVLIFMQTSDGQLAPPVTVPVGVAPADVTFADMDGKFGLDIIVANQSSGDVSVLLNDADHAFRSALRFRAGTGLYGLAASAAGPVVQSREQTVAVVAGEFDGAPGVDLVAVDRDAHRLALLAGSGNGRFADPQGDATALTSARPGAAVSADFDGDGVADLAVLMADRAEVWVYAAGGGTFVHTFSAPAGDMPTGLAVVAAGDGRFDLLVGNESGDVLRLVGDGRGGFALPEATAGDRVPLAVEDIDGNGSADVLLARQSDDRVEVQTRQPATGAFTRTAMLDDADPTRLAPGEVSWAKLDGPSDPFFDAVVVGTASNTVQVYRGTGFAAGGRPTFAPPQTIFVGSAPAGVAIADLDGDGVTDLAVPNQGSNDVSVLIGRIAGGGTWAVDFEQRRAAGGAGPIAVAARDQTGDGRADLIVTNAQSGTLTLLPQVAGSLFDDRDPAVLTLPGNAAPLPPAVSESAGRVFIPTVGGPVLAVNLAGGADFAALAVLTVFAPPPGAEVTAVDEAELPGGGVALAAAGRGGLVTLLGSVNGLAFQTLGLFQDFTLSSPSALDLVGVGSRLDVYVTNAGGSLPSFFSLDMLPGVDPAPPAPPPVVPLTGPPVLVPPVDPGSSVDTPSALTTPLGTAPLAVAPVLVGGLVNPRRADDAASVFGPGRVDEARTAEAETTAEGTARAESEVTEGGDGTGVVPGADDEAVAAGQVEEEKVPLWTDFFFDPEETLRRLIEAASGAPPAASGADVAAAEAVDVAPDEAALPAEVAVPEPAVEAQPSPVAEAVEAPVPGETPAHQGGSAAAAFFLGALAARLAAWRDRRGRAAPAAQQPSRLAATRVMSLPAREA